MLSGVGATATAVSVAVAIVDVVAHSQSSLKEIIVMTVRSCFQSGLGFH